MNLRQLIPSERWDEAQALVKRLTRLEVLEPALTQRLAKDGRVVDIWLTATALVNQAGKVYAIAATERGSGLHE
jgi:two-component system CheB/CheR fusion protein